MAINSINVILVEGTFSEASEIRQHIHHKDIILLIGENMIPKRLSHPALGSKTKGQ
jgi:hypothetical protein